MALIHVAIAGFVLSAALTRAAIPLLVHARIVAHQNDRTMHLGAIPKGGGVPLLVAVALAVAFAGGGSGVLPALSVGTLVLTGLSLWNDFGHLPPTVRLPVHIAVAAWLVWSLPEDARILADVIPLWLERALAAFALVTFMNFFNFMDGINGIAGAEAIAIAGGYLALAAVTGESFTHAPLAAALAGACAGFLLWNARKSALLFLGDSGSVPIGFLTGAILIDLAAHGFLTAAIILPAVFVADAATTLLKRIVRRERFWEGHRSHAYQRAAQAAGSHLAIVGRVSVANVALIAAALVSARSWVAGLAIGSIALGALFLKLEAVARSRSSDSGPSQR